MKPDLPITYLNPDSSLLTDRRRSITIPLLLFINLQRVSCRVVFIRYAFPLIKQALMRAAAAANREPDTLPAFRIIKGAARIDVPGEQIGMIRGIQRISWVPFRGGPETVLRFVRIFPTLIQPALIIDPEVP